MNDLKQLLRGLISGVLRLTAVVLLAGAAALCGDNYLLQQDQEEAARRLDALGAAQVSLETPQTTLVVLGRSAGSDPAAELRGLDWREKPSRLHGMVPWAAGGAALALVVWRWLLAWRLALVAACAVLTGGLFASVNNLLLRHAADARATQVEVASYYRADFLSKFGYDPTVLLTEDDARAFLDAHDALQEALTLFGGNKDAPRAPVLTRIVAQTDVELLKTLEQHLGVSARQWPRPANNYLGYNDMFTAVLTARAWAPTVAAAPTVEALKKMVLSVTVDPNRRPEQVAGLSMYAVLQRQQMELLTASTALGVARRLNGIVQWITVGTFFCGGLLLLSRLYSRVDRPLNTLGRLLPGGRAEVPAVPGVCHDKVLQLWQELEARRAAHSGRAADGAEELLYSAAQSLGVTRNIDAGRTSLEAAANRVGNRIDSEFSLINYCIWLVPALGFVGTVLGISDAVFEARLLGEGDVLTGLAKCMANLGVAFDTTFCALIGSIILLFAAMRVRRREEEVLDRIESQVLNQLVYGYIVPAAGPPSPSTVTGGANP